MTEHRVAMNQDAAEENSRPGARLSFVAKLRHPWVLLYALLTLLSSGIFVYSQTMAFVWDEGFHLVAAQLISWGKTPYIDFPFPQTLLNAYFNAAVLRIFGDSWHSVHAFDALFVVLAVWLSATYVMRRFPEPRWRLPCAVIVACFVCLNTVVVPFGPVGQAYGIGTFLVVAAFRAAIRSVRKESLAFLFVTALLAGSAASCTLLTAPVVPVLLIWLMMRSGAGNRLRTFMVFTAGVCITFAPELWLFIKAPQQTFFNVVQYQALFRRVNWGDATSHDFDVFTDWTVSAQTLLLGLFDLIGILFIIRKSDWDRSVRQEFYLALAISLALGLYIATAHPTFGRYFIFMVPFMAIIATAGFFYTGAQLISPGKPGWPTAIVVFIIIASIAKYVFDDRESTNWQDYEDIAAKVKEVTPPGKEYMADELVYFLLRQTPPSAMEFSYSHKLELNRKQEALYHIISLKELKEQIAHGRFETVETCKDDIVDDFKLNEIFKNKEDFNDCTVFWRHGNQKK